MSLTRGNKKLSALSSRMIPSHIRDEKPEFETFMKGFFRYLEQEGNPYDVISHIFEYGDIDLTADQYVEHFRKTYMPTIPENFTDDFRLLLKRIKSFYQAKGSEKGFQFLLRFLFNTETTFYYPKVDMLRTSAGKWRTPTYIRPKGSPSINDMNFYVDTKIQGGTSGATAWVEKLESYLGSVHFRIDESTLEGTFADDEELVIIDANKDISAYTSISSDDLNPPSLVQSTGDWEDQTGWLSDRNKIQDSFYYQDFSYVLISEISLKFYKEILKDLVHPAGFEVFGELLLTSDLAIETDILPNSVSETLISSETDKIVAMSLNDVIALAKFISEKEIFYSYSYYEDNREDPIISLIFNPETMDGVPQSGFEDTPDSTMPYFSSDIAFLLNWGESEKRDYIDFFLDASKAQNLGNSVRISKDGTRGIIGSYDENPFVANRGSARSFRIEDGTTILETVYFNFISGGNLGTKVDLDGAGSRTLVNYSDDSRTISNGGSVEVWKRTGTSYTPEDILEGSNVNSGDFFGHHVVRISDSGDRAFVSNANADGLGTHQGSVYVFERSGTVWSESQELIPSDPSNNTYFGTMFDISDDGSIVAIWRGTGPGAAVYIFKESGGTWSETEKLTVSGAHYQTSDIALNSSGSLLVLGQKTHTSNDGDFFVYEDTGSSWVSRPKDLAWNSYKSGKSWEVGASLTISDNYIFVGAPGYDKGVNTDCGAFFVFEWTGTEYTKISERHSSDYDSGEVGSFAGESGNMSVDNGSQYLLVSDPDKTVDGTLNAGSIYLFKDILRTPQ